jgi:hypothetical protein
MVEALSDTPAGHRNRAVLLLGLRGASAAPNWLLWMWRMFCPRMKAWW